MIVFLHYPTQLLQTTRNAHFLTLHIFTRITNKKTLKSLFTPTFGTITCLTIKFRKPLRERGAKAPNQRKVSPRLSPLCRCAAATESTHKSHCGPTVQCHPSPVSVVTTEPPRRSHMLQRQRLLQPFHSPTSLSLLNY